MKKLVASCLVLLAATALASAGVPATPPPALSFCDLLSNPKAFDGQWIQVRGRISLGFEDFTLWEQSCDKPLARSVWLEYGGDEEPPTKFCCGDHSRPKGKDFSVRGQTIPLIRDAPMQDLMQKVRDRRSCKANGQPCAGSLCNLYRVSATLAGLFFAAPEEPQGGSKGYGISAAVTCWSFTERRMSLPNARPYLWIASASHALHKPGRLRCPRMLHCAIPA